MSSIDEFIAKHKITLTATRVAREPGYILDHKPFERVKFLIPTPTRDDDGWAHYAWSVSLFRGEQPPIDGLTVPYRTGIGHVERKGTGVYEGISWPKYQPTEPQVRDVLDCLALDSNGYENTRNFAEWCGEYGFDTDSRKAEETYRQVIEQAHALKIFLGRDAYEELLWETEGL